MSENNKTRHWHSRLTQACECLSAIMFATLFLTFVAQVFWRYVLRDPLVWTLEVSGILFVTLSLFTAATQMSLREHVALDLLLDALPKKLSAWLRAFSLLLFAGIMFYSIPDTIRVLEWMYQERTFAIKFNLGHLFLLMIAFVFIYAGRAIFDAVRLINGTRDNG
ncbi:MAG TPA: hypothetical protein DCQ47_05555 [Gammaproteobacteria bacterium]|nr:hypothetical protein [Gammaproteobacteria bacterium]|tara:strand:- start:301 stop:795 length:495 start_codon:yes stop_codon:yes gene_type:complete